MPAIADGAWVLDPSRTSIRLKQKTMWGMVTVKGRFVKFSGEGQVGADGVGAGSLTIDAASLDTAHGKRDAHLRSSDFFHTEEHPQIVFTATTARVGGDGVAQVDGQLTVRGTTRPLSFSAQTDIESGAVIASAELVIDRADFGLTWNRGGMMKGLTTVFVTARFVRA